MFVYKGVGFFLFEGVQNSACSLSDYICGVEKYLNFVCVRLRPHACVCELLAIKIGCNKESLGNKDCRIFKQFILKL